MDIMDINIFDELLDKLEYCNGKMSVIPIDDLLEELEIKIKCLH